MRLAVFILVLSIIVFSCEHSDKKHPVTPVRLLDSTSIIQNLIYFSSDSCQGRRPGTEGHRLSIKRIAESLRSAGVDSLGSSLLQEFQARFPDSLDKGINLVGVVKGKIYPEKFIVVSAHFDHLGKVNENPGYYYGADDNASGTACLLGLADYFADNPHKYSLIFAAFDREESGLEGSYAFTKTLSTDSSMQIVFNLNLDMIARSDKNEIYACGLYHYPQLSYLVEEVKNKTNVKLLKGHDQGPLPDNWTTLSDHYPFHLLKIPFLYIGVEDHQDYHKPSDTYDKINFSSYIENCNMLLMLLQAYR